MAGLPLMAWAGCTAGKGAQGWLAAHHTYLPLQRLACAPACLLLFCPPLQAANATSPGLTDLLTHPGWTGTLLVPTDAAFDAALAQYREQPAASGRRCAACGRVAIT